MKVSFWVCDR